MDRPPRSRPGSSRMAGSWILQLVVAGAIAIGITLGKRPPGIRDRRARSRRGFRPVCWARCRSVGAVQPNDGGLGVDGILGIAGIAGAFGAGIAGAAGMAGAFGAAGIAGAAGMAGSFGAAGIAGRAGIAGGFGAAGNPTCL